MYEEVIEFSTEVDELVDITERVEEVVERSGIKNGLCLVFNLGSTGAILINEWEEGLLEDFKEILAKLTSGRHRHPSNAHSHLKAGIIGPGKVIGVRNGKLELGTWQSIIFCEFDVRPRNRRVLVKVIGD